MSRHTWGELSHLQSEMNHQVPLFFFAESYENHLKSIPMDPAVPS